MLANNQNIYLIEAEIKFPTIESLMAKLTDREMAKKANLTQFIKDQKAFAAKKTNESDRGDNKKSRDKDDKKDKKRCPHCNSPNHKKADC
jgi:hypothetical protein